MKYDVVFSCGHEGTVELYGESSYRERKLAFFREEGQCTECYKAAMRAKNAATPLTLKIGLRPFNTAYPISCYFCGNVYPVKDTVKSLGYMYGDCALSMLDFARKPEKLWHNDISPDDLVAEIEKVKSAFPEIIIVHDYNETDLAVARNIIAERQVAKDKAAAEIAAIPKPEKPKCYPQGRWNGKIYRNNTIYVDGEAVKLTPKEAEAIQKYDKDYREYKNKVDTIMIKN